MGRRGVCGFGVSNKPTSSGRSCGRERRVERMQREDAKLLSGVPGPSRSVWVPASVYPPVKWGCKGSIVGSGRRACLCWAGSSSRPKASQPSL